MIENTTKKQAIKIGKWNKKYQKYQTLSELSMFWSIVFEFCGLTLCLNILFLLPLLVNFFNELFCCLCRFSFGSSASRWRYIYFGVLFYFLLSLLVASVIFFLDELFRLNIGYRIVLSYAYVAWFESNLNGPSVCR